MAPSVSTRPNILTRDHLQRAVLSVGALALATLKEPWILRGSESGIIFGKAAIQMEVSGLT